MKTFIYYFCSKLFFMKYLFINLKSYKEDFGSKTLRIANNIRELKKDYKNVSIVLLPNILQLKETAVITTVFSQHSDPLDAYRNTGFVPLELVKKAKAKGTMINHSEHRLKKEDVKKTIFLSKKFGLKTLVCVKNDSEAEFFSSFKPDFIAVEPPRLIAGKKSISEENPGLIKKTVSKVKSVDKNIKVLVGAGIHTIDDVKKALFLGADGILLSSQIALSHHTKKDLKKLLDAF